MPKSKEQKRQEAVARNSGMTDEHAKHLRNHGYSFRDRPDILINAERLIEAYDRLVQHYKEIGVEANDARGRANAICDGYATRTWLSHSITLKAARETMSQHHVAELGQYMASR